MRRVLDSGLRLILTVVVVVGVVACGPAGDPGDTGNDIGTDSVVPDVVDQDNVSIDIPDVREVISADTDEDVDLPDSETTDDGDVNDSYEVTDGDVMPDVEPDVVDARDVVDVEVVDIVEDPGQAEDVGPGPCEDDGLDCTDEVRGDDGTCSSVIQAEWCVIEGECISAESVNPENICLECLPELTAIEWSVVEQKECDDGLACTVSDMCDIDGVCAGEPVVCPDDGESCTDEVCNPENGNCETTTRANGANCADDGNECTFDRCQGGVCVHAIRNGAVCSDGDLCTTGDACNSAGECVGILKSCPDDGNVCTENGCDPETGNCRNVPVEDGSACDDYNWCTLDDGCLAGTCTGDARDCDDDDPCTFDSCVDGPMGYCTNDPVLGACEDGDLCTIGETCNMEGVCGGGQPKICDDFNACTDDSCESTVGCVFSPNYNFCDDADPCTEGDSCDESGECVGIPKDCDDANECTRDYCFMGNCHHDNVTNGIDCEDGDVCTVGGTCSFGVCEPAGNVDCDDGNPCTTDLCDPIEGCYTEPTLCDDENECTNDSCDPASGCVFSPNTNLCDDGDACTEGDVCSGSVCAGTPLDCSDGDSCTLDVCTDGQCSNPPNTGECDDGNACTYGERCYDGVCTNGFVVDCYDGKDCTADSCDPAVGCVYEPISGGCDDGTVCTVNDTCQNGECVGQEIDCSDDNFCTDDLCHPLDGCYWENNALLCDDGNPCTTVDQCGGGTCAGNIVFRTPLMKAGSYLIGSDGNPGNGLDVDGDSGTCLPSGKCSAGIDNAFANMSLMVKDQFNPDLQDRTASGELAMFLEPEEPGPVGSPFEMKMFFGHKTAPTSCNAATSGCNYLAFKADTIGQCTVKYAFGDATTLSSHISAGGIDPVTGEPEAETVVYFMIGAYPMPVALKWARVEADITVSGNSVTGGSGILGGVINKMDFKYALQSVPESNFSPYTRSQVILNVDQNLPMDADVDGNGVNESSSIGIRFTIVQGNVVGRDI